MGHDLIDILKGNNLKINDLITDLAKKTDSHPEDILFLIEQKMREGLLFSDENFIIHVKNDTSN